MKKTYSVCNLAFILFISIFSNLANADPQNTVMEKSPPTNLSELKSAIATLISENKVPAVAIAMIDENGPIWIDAIGKANIEKGIDADKNTLFRIGSTSKMFVALSVLKLVEEGKLSLSDKLMDLAPEISYQNQWRDTVPIRIVHLLEHTTGWDDIHLPEFAHNDPTPATLKEGLDYHPHSRVSRWQPGTRMSYANSGSAVVAYIIEKTTGMNFELYVQKNFFEPLAMTSSSYTFSDEVKARGATLYSRDNKAQDYWHIITRPSGAINSSIVDMSKFLALFVNRGLVNGQQLVPAQSLDRMETVTSTSAAKAGQQAGYGLANYSSNHEHWIYQGHNGAVNGGLTELAYLPEAKLGHVIMTNSGDSATFKEISKLVKDFETRNLAYISPSEEEKILTDEQKNIAGLYVQLNSRQQQSFFLDRIFSVQKMWFDGDSLIRKPLLGGEAVYYQAVSDNLYRAEKGGLISLSKVNDPIDGQVIHAENSVLKLVSAFRVYSQIGFSIFWLSIIVSSGLYFIIWGIRKLTGKIPKGASTSIRLWPLLASLSIVLLVTFFIKGHIDVYQSFGTPSLYSIGMMLMSASFAFFALLGGYSSIVNRHELMNRANYWYSTVSSVTHLIVALYFFSYGVIGIVMWA